MAPSIPLQTALPLHQAAHGLADDLAVGAIDAGFHLLADEAGHFRRQGDGELFSRLHRTPSRTG